MGADLAAGVRTAYRKTRRAIAPKAHGFVHPAPELIGAHGTSSLDLGCGAVPRNPFGAETVYGVEIVDVGSDSVRVADLVVEAIPDPDQVFDAVTAYDFLEHVPRLLYVAGQRRAPFIELMNEIHRVLKPGGYFLARTPAFPHADAWSDPTHVNTITDRTVVYFTHTDYRELVQAYGFRGSFELVDQYWDKASSQHLIWLLRAVH